MVYPSIYVFRRPILIILRFKILVFNCFEANFAHFPKNTFIFLIILFKQLPAQLTGQLPAQLPAQLTAQLTGPLPAQLPA